nr:MAG TPA: Recombination ATPase helicase [Caudoviricetes sp.]
MRATSAATTSSTTAATMSITSCARWPSTSRTWLATRSRSGRSGAAMELRDYQAAAVEQVAAAGGTGLLALALGAGKTLTALACAERSLKEEGREPEGARVLIVAPLHTIDGWRRHVEEVWGLELRECAAKGADRKANLEALWDRQECGVFFIGWSLMTARNKHKKKDNRTGKMVSAPDTHAFGGTLFDVVIADEVHRACNPRSLNSKVLCRIRARRRLALSATPAGNLPVNIFGALHFLWPVRYTSFTRFADFFFKSQFNPYSDTGYGKLYGEEKWPGRVRATTPCWVSVTREQALPELADVDIRRVAATMTRDQKRIYKQWRDKAIAWLDDHPVAVNLPVVLDTRLQQVTLAQPIVTEHALQTREGGVKEVVTFDKDSKSGKIDALLDILRDLGDERVIVFTHSRKFLVPLRWRLEKAGYRVEQVSGDDHEGWRTFRDDHGVQILLAVVSAIAEGVDGLQTDCHTEIWLSRDSSLVINEQAQGRLHRSGQERGVVRYLVQCPGTIDDTVVGRLAERHRALTESGLI